MKRWSVFAAEKPEMAEAGHAAWQAVTISPSRNGRFSFSDSMRAELMR